MMNTAFITGIEVWWQSFKRGWQKTLGSRTRGQTSTHDAWLRDAVWYIVHGRWIDENEDALKTEEQSILATHAVNQVREFAKKGQLQIWGKVTAAESHQAIPSHFWIKHEIDALGLLIAVDPEKIFTEPVTSSASLDRHYALRVNKAQIEKIWPPGRYAAGLNIDYLAP